MAQDFEPLSEVGEIAQVFIERLSDLYDIEEEE